MNLNYPKAKRGEARGSRIAEQREAYEVAAHYVMSLRPPTNRQRRAIWALCRDLGVPTPRFEDLSRDDARAMIGSLKLRQVNRDQRVSA